MGRKELARKLVKQLEKKTMTFKEVQGFLWKQSNGISQSEKVEVCRGYWCNNLTQLYNSKIIGKHPKYGYFALPGSSKRQRMFEKDASPHAYFRSENKIHLQAIQHPQIKKKIIKDGTLQEYI